MEQPKIAVLLAAYNGMLWIGEQVDSILNQCNVDVTIYISVDPSTDGTEAWCSALAANNSQVVLLPFAGKFGGAGKNFYRLLRDVDFAGFDFIAFSDQDDIWFLDKLERATHLLRSGAYDAYSSNVTAFWFDGSTHIVDKAQPQVAWDYLFEAAGPGCTYVISKQLAVCLKSEILDKWEVVQSIALHDWFCYAYARSNAYQWLIDPKPSVMYRQHATNQLGANVGFKPLLARFRVISSGWWFRQVSLMVSVLGKTEDSFVAKWIRLDFFQLLFLATQAHKCRRRLRDKLFFVFICFASMVTVALKAERMKSED